MAVMAVLTQCLMVGLVPELLLIAAVRLDVIHNGGGCVSAMLQAVYAQRMLA